ncbi:methanogen output domain 1-containing protein [Methylobacterium sp. Leaf399]|uniref:methanogen output domain 1-containing protein n=1 Tax=Methylobacterium sp. Leaf399 TaxID=1736364 RepID=UPI001FCD64C6|nr:methanogen output domain 1-containing protein [Methylobacterium sp. Leaf399]
MSLNGGAVPMEPSTCGVTDFKDAPIPIGLERFLGLVIRSLSTALEDTVGSHEAGGFISLVGIAISEEVQAEYLRAAGAERLGREAVSNALIDLKRRLGGDFYVIEDTAERIVLGNRRCPFGDLAKECPSLCTITSHVFGHMVAESQGYGRVTLAETIARGAQECRIVIDLDPDAPDHGGQSYFGNGNA